MIGKVLRGRRVDGLIWYLYGPGKANDHVDPHIVAGWRHPAEVEPPIKPDGRRDFRRLNGLLKQPLAALGDRNFDRPVWHCVARAAHDDVVLSDDEWADIAGTIMSRTGIARDDDDQAVRWVAIRHAADHIHIVATLARQDGTRPRVWNDFYRVREICLAVEARYGLQATAPGDRTAARRPTRAEGEQAQRRQLDETPRVALRRHVATAAAGAGTEEQFFQRLAAAGVLTRKRFSENTPGQVTGYAVALPQRVTGSGEPVWYGGGRLAADLTLPKLRRRWTRRVVPEAQTTSGPWSGEDLSPRSVRAVLRNAARSAAAESRNEDVFFAHLSAAGVLVRKRFSERNPADVTGYAVTLAGHVDQRGQLRWYGGGRLADELTLPKLRHRWGHGTDGHAPRGTHEPVDRLTAEERAAMWADATHAATAAAQQIRRHTRRDPTSAADAAWAAADVLHVAADALDSTTLRRAADAYDRAARPPYGRIPHPTAAGNRLRTAARLLTVRSLAGGTLATATLTANLAALAAAVADLRRAQQRAAQAAGARKAAEGLLHATGQPPQQHPAPTSTEPYPSQPTKAAAGLVRADFPNQPSPQRPTPRPRTPASEPRVPRPRSRRRGPRRT